MQAAPGDGIEDYYGRRWGIPTEVVGKFKEEPYVEVWQLHESGSGFDYLAERKEIGPNGEKTTSEDTWTWHAPVKRRGPAGADMLASASLIGPNTIQIIYLAEDQGVTEIQTHKFTAAGIEVSLHYGGNKLNVNIYRKPLWQPRPTEAWGRGSCSRASMKGSMRTEHLFHSLFCPSPLLCLSLGPHLYIMAERNEKVF